MVLAPRERALLEASLLAIQGRRQVFFQKVPGRDHVPAQRVWDGMGDELVWGTSMGDGHEIMTLSPCPIGAPAPPPRFSPGVNPATVGDFPLRLGPTRPWAAGPPAGCPSPGDFRFRIVDFGLLNFEVQNSGTHWVFEIRTWRLGPSPWLRPPRPPKGVPGGVPGSQLYPGPFSI